VSHSTFYFTEFRGNIRQFVAVFLTCVLALAVFATAASAQTAPTQLRIISKVNGAKHAGELHIPANQSQVLRLDVPFSELLVGNPKIADVLALTNRSIYVLGKKFGTTSLIINDKDKGLIAIVDITVSHDIEGLKARLFEVMPDEKIEVREANGALLLSGAMSSSTRLAQAVDIAMRFAQDPKRFVNLLTLKGSQQVMLAVRFAEVARSVVKELGLNSQISNSNFRVTSGDALLSGLFAATSFVTGATTFGLGTATVRLAFDALEKKGVVKTLAEPNLIALSGETASFLAGGEFPVPVAQDSSDGGSSITVEFKEFGVSLSFTPTVLDGGLINVVVAPEVSKIDTSRSVTLSGFIIPGLSTRRAKTTVELRSGQSFAIAGLIQNDFEDTINQFPGLGDVPVLSALFRSTDFTRNETELVIIVTPHLVKPAEPGTLASPVDKFVPPAEFDMYLFGRTESPRSGTAAISPTLQGAGGIEGRYGHVVK
jgi:pilus assembly protein CpaC